MMFFRRFVICQLSANVLIYCFNRYALGPQLEGGTLDVRGAIGLSILVGIAGAHIGIVIAREWHRSSTHKGEGGAK